MNTLLKDICEQPVALNSALNEYKNYLPSLKSLKKHYGGRTIVFVGMGASLFASYVAAVWLNKKGITAFAVDASELLYYNINGLPQDSLVVLISQSGESIEIRGLIQIFKEKGIDVIGISNAPDSFLSRELEKVFLLKVCGDHSVAVKTYTSSLVLLSLVAEAFAGGNTASVIEGFARAIEGMVKFTDKGMENMGPAAEMFHRGGYIVLAGRGFSYASAQEGALLLKEGCKVYAEGMTGGGFRHGAVEIVDSDVRTVIFAPGDTDLPLRLTNQVLDYGGKVLLISGSPQKIEHPDLVKLATGQETEYGAVLFEIVPVQFLCYLLAEHKGIQAGYFRNTVSVIKTE